MKKPLYEILINKMDNITCPNILSFVNHKLSVTGMLLVGYTISLFNPYPGYLPVSVHFVIDITQPSSMLDQVYDFPVLLTPSRSEHDIYMPYDTFRLMIDKFGDRGILKKTELPNFLSRFILHKLPNQIGKDYEVTTITLVPNDLTDNRKLESSGLVSFFIKCTYINKDRDKSVREALNRQTKVRFNLKTTEIHTYSD